jgi:hypothetical protein
MDIEIRSEVIRSLRLLSESNYMEPRLLVFSSQVGEMGTSLMAGVKVHVEKSAPGTYAESLDGLLINRVLIFVCSYLLPERVSFQSIIRLPMILRATRLTFSCAISVRQASSSPFPQSGLHF